MPPRLLTTQEAAKELQITARRVRQLYDAGILTGEKRGRDVFIDPASIAQAKERKTSRGPEPKSKKN